MKNPLITFIAPLLTVIIFLSTQNIALAQLNATVNYVWNSADAPKIFNNKLQLSFVSSAQGFSNYGTVLAGGGYSTSQDGGVFQIYFPYGTSWGGNAPKIRLGLYNNFGWSNWETIFTSANANGPTSDWITKNLIAYGNILIGKTTQSNTSYKLDVDGIIRSQKVIVNANGADFVFDSGYHLPELDSLNAFIQKYHHLPDISSADEMKKEGLNVGDNQMILLQKIEELTLYLIQLRKKIDLKDMKIKQLESMNLRLKVIEEKLNKK